jgi:hypothetical protein
MNVLIAEAILSVLQSSFGASEPPAKYSLTHIEMSADATPIMARPEIRLTEIFY